MADRVDEKRRIEYGECAPHAGEEEAADSTHHAVVEKADEKRARQARQEQEGVVLVLPDRNGIVRDPRCIFWIGVPVGDKEPSTVAMPKSLLRIIRIFLLVTVCMMTQMIGGPFDSRVLKRPGASDQEGAFDPIRAVKTSVGHQSMVADRDAQSADDIEQTEHRPVEPCIVVEIPIERDSDHGAQTNGAKEDEGPDPAATADLDRSTLGGDCERR